MARVTRLEPERPRSRRWVVELDDDRWRFVPKTVVSKLGLEAGDEVPRDVLERQVAELEPAAARERAIYLLSHHERSSAGLERKLAEDGFGEAIAHDVVADLAGSGLVDDERFAESLTRSLAVGRGYGRARVARELARHGVTSEAAEAAMDRVCPGDDELARATEAAIRMTRGRAVDPRRLAARLARRGFRLGVAFTAARDVLGEEDGTDA